MNSKTSLKETADRIMKFSAKVLGMGLETHGKYIEEREGKKGLKKIEEKMKKLGYPLKFEEIKTFKYYPVGLADLVIIVAKEIFNWTEKDIFEMGNVAPKYSLFTKILAKYFLNLEQTTKEIPKYWRKHFTEGELEIELHKKEKNAIVHLEYNITHPLVCIFFAGYFLRIATYVIKSPKINIKETRCQFKGDSYHEFLISWQ